MKLRNIVLAGILAVSFAFVGCSGNTDTAKTEKKEESSGVRKITVNNIEYEIPTNPEKVVVGEGYVGDVIALGIKPLGTVMRPGYDYKYLKPHLEGVANLGAPMSLEKTLELKPDIIITYDEKNLEKFKQIAPTVHIPYGYTKNTHEELRLIGDILNKKDEAEKWLKEFDEDAKKAREKISTVVPKDATFGLYEIYNKDLYVYGDNWGRGGQAIYNALGLRAPEKIQKEIIEGPQYAKVSTEVLPQYAADYMFLTQFGDNQMDKAELTKSSVWKNLDAVKNNKIFLNDFESFRDTDPISVKGQMDVIVDMLISNAKK